MSRHRPLLILLSLWACLFAAPTQGVAMLWAHSFSLYGNLLPASGTRKWSDGTPVAGQGFGYTFDDIGNRKTVTRGTRSGAWGADTVNQLAPRAVPDKVDVMGEVNPGVNVAVNAQAVTRQGNYFHAETGPAARGADGDWQNVRIAAAKPGAGARVALGEVTHVLQPHLLDPWPWRTADEAGTGMSVVGELLCLSAIDIHRNSQLTALARMQHFLDMMAHMDIRVIFTRVASAKRRCWEW